MKIVIITAILIPAADDKSNEALENDIQAKLEHMDIPWVKLIENVKILSET